MRSFEIFGVPITEDTLLLLLGHANEISPDATLAVTCNGQPDLTLMQRDELGIASGALIRR